MKRIDSLLLPEQPFDDYLLRSSRLYRSSREFFLKQRGRFSASLLSSARALGAAELIENEIQYSPVASELSWACTDRIQKKDLDYEISVQSWITSVFHEQNHRILWNEFRKLGWACPTQVPAACRYLNFAESLVVILDMAFSDELDVAVAKSLYSRRVVYSPGEVRMRKLGVGSRYYHEALLVCLHATYLRLEGMHPEDVPVVMRDVMKGVFLGLSNAIFEVCIERALKLEPRFVDLTNPIWQKKNVKKVIAALGPNRKSKELILPRRRPEEFKLEFEIAEKWLRLFQI